MIAISALDMQLEWALYIPLDAIVLFNRPDIAGLGILFLSRPPKGAAL